MATTDSRRDATGCVEISNQLLCHLAEAEPLEAYGEMSDEKQKLLCVTLPDLVAELQSWREGNNGVVTNTTALHHLVQVQQRAGRFPPSRPACACLSVDL